MLREIEVVVARERQEPPPVALHPDAVLAQRLGQRAAQAAAFEAVEFGLREGVERVHQVPLGHRRAKGPFPARGKRRMAEDTSKSKAPPGWYGEGFSHIWLPYAQMKTAREPLAVARTHGSRIVLADGHELIDGIASWWTAC